MTLLAALCGLPSRTFLVTGAEPDPEETPHWRLYLGARWKQHYVLVDEAEAKKVWGSGSPHVFVDLPEDAVIYDGGSA
jgi:hypothetical protein